MHLFLVKLDDSNVIAHLHPLRVAPDTFVTQLPAIPKGAYVYFGDVLFETGSQRTLIDTVMVPAGLVASTDAVTEADDVRAPAIDADDSWRELVAVPLGAAVPLAGGGTLSLSADAPVEEGRDLRLVVDVRDEDGGVSQLEPYMGMMGHAMVYRLDGGVFMHVHPMGTSSMTAQLQLERLERGDTSRVDSAELARLVGHIDHGARVLSFPFAFPSAGSFRVYVQVKRGGVVETAAFDVVVGG